MDPNGMAQTGPHEDLHRGAGTMIAVRWLAVPWVLLQIFAYEIPYPPGYKNAALGFLGALIVGNAALMLAHRGRNGQARAHAIGLLGLALDVAILSAFVWLYAFDYQTQIWAVLFIAPLEGAILFQLRGAMWAWAIIAVSYSLRDVWGAARFDNPLIWNSITFRMGIGGIIALVAGLMARDLVKQRAHLADALTKLQQVDRMRSGLISMLGHDVRSPLTVIRGVVGTLLTKNESVSAKDRRMLLESADRQARRLEALANDLLDLARVHSGRLELEAGPVVLGDAVRESLSYVEGAGDIAVDCEDDLVVLADPRRLEQVIINLVSNALHHGAPPVSVSARRLDHTAIIDVADHGPGVPVRELAGLFEPFNAERKTGSVGYGLAIVKALVEAQNGSVAYMSNGDSGAKFRVTLPLS